MTLNITSDYYHIANNIENSYRYRVIAKRNGGRRLLQIPDRRLCKIQRAILDEVVMYFPIHSSATAFLRGSSILCNAKYHTDYPVVLNLDLRDFFPTVTYSRVLGLFIKHTKLPKKTCVLLANLCCLDKSLPQGAPTSPALANAAFYHLDRFINSYCLRKDINYTRYADDMTFSGDFDPAHIIAFVKRALAGEYVGKTADFPDTDKNPFLLNPGKIRIYRSGDRQTVTGLIVNKKLQVTKEYRKNIRQEMYFIKKYGIEEHLNRSGDCTQKTKYIQSLSGRVAHVLFVNPKDEEFLQYKEFLKKSRFNPI